LSIEYITTTAAINLMPLLSTIGFGGIAGFLIGFAIKKVMKILAVVAGVFFAVLLYLESHEIVAINWDKLQNISQGVLSTISNVVATTTRQIGGGSNSAAATAAILPASAVTITNLGIPLTSSAAAGFAIGFMKG
jgi:uncharacterized membrane protein (Fun14 family)